MYNHFLTIFKTTLSLFILSLSFLFSLLLLISKKIEEMVVTNIICV